MTENEALIILGSEKENAAEMMLDKLFEHKTFLLKSVVTPQVFSTRGRKIAVLGDAFQVVSETENKSISTPVPTPFLQLLSAEISDWLSFYRLYETQMSAIKLVLMRSNDPHTVSDCCFTLADLEAQKLNEIATFATTEYVLDETQQKISDFVNSGEIIKELKNTNEQHISTQNITLFPALMKDMIRSRKYANFTQQKEIKNA